MSSQPNDAMSLPLVSTTVVRTLICRRPTLGIVGVVESVHLDRQDTMLKVMERLERTVNGLLAISDNHGFPPTRDNLCSTLHWPRPATDITSLVDSCILARQDVLMTILLRVENRQSSVQQGKGAGGSVGVHKDKVISFNENSKLTFR